MVGREEYDVALWAERVGKGVSWLAWSMNLGITALGFDSSRMKGAFYLPFHVSITTPVSELARIFYLL